MFEAVKKYWQILIGVIGAIIGLIFWKKSQDDRAKLDHANNTTDNAVTTAKIDMLTEELKKEKERIEKEKGRKLTDKELEDFLKRL